MDPPATRPATSTPRVPPGEDAPSRSPLAPGEGRPRAPMDAPSALTRATSLPDPLRRPDTKRYRMSDAPRLGLPPAASTRARAGRRGRAPRSALQRLDLRLRADRGHPRRRRGAGPGEPLHALRPQPHDHRARGEARRPRGGRDGARLHVGHGRRGRLHPRARPVRRSRRLHRRRLRRDLRAPGQGSAAPRHHDDLPPGRRGRAPPEVLGGAPAWSSSRRRPTRCST